MTDRSSTADPPGPQRIAQSEVDHLAHMVTERFAPYLQSAESAVREAEHELNEARDALARAEQAAVTTRYVSDPLVFMRVTVREELDALSRKTTPKKLRASYRYLLARAAELAAGELRGFQNDLESARRDREQGVESCRRAEQQALRDLDGARAMHQRLRDAERAARDGLAMLVEKLEASPR